MDHRKRKLLKIFMSQYIQEKLDGCENLELFKEYQINFSRFFIQLNCLLYVPIKTIFLRYL